MIENSRKRKETCDKDNDIDGKKVSQKRLPKTPIANIRTSPNGLYRLVRGLSEVQKQAVMDIGFGSLLSLRISKLPCSIALYMLQHFNHRISALVLSNGQKMVIDEDDVQCVLNIPRGEFDVIESIGQSSKDEPEFLAILRAWRTRWVGSETRGAPLIVSMPERILANEAADDDFKRDFVVYVVSSFLWATQSPTCRFKILKSLVDVERIKDLNWCRYTLNGLVESVRKWQANEASLFHGPGTFLMLCYMDRVADFTQRKNVRKFPILSCWDDKMIFQRLRTEEALGGYGKGRVLDRIPLLAPVTVVAPTVTASTVAALTVTAPTVATPCLHARSAWDVFAEAAVQLSTSVVAIADASRNLNTEDNTNAFIKSAIEPAMVTMFQNADLKLAIQEWLQESNFHVTPTQVPSLQCSLSTSPPTELHSPTLKRPTPTSNSLAPAPNSSKSPAPAPTSNIPTLAPNSLRSPAPTSTSNSSRSPVPAPISNSPTTTPNSPRSLALAPTSSSPTTAPNSPRSFALAPTSNSPVSAPNSPKSLALTLNSPPHDPPPNSLKSHSPSPIPGPSPIHILSENLITPYLKDIHSEFSTMKVEDRDIIELVFASGLNKKETLYYNNYTTLSRDDLMSMAKNTYIIDSMIDAWAWEMNVVERDFPSPKKRIFFSTMHISISGYGQEIYNASMQTECDAFNMKIEDLDRADLIFLPVARGEHFYLAVYNIIRVNDKCNGKLDVIDNRLLPKGVTFASKYNFLEPTLAMFVEFLRSKGSTIANILPKMKQDLLKLKWQNHTNTTDCGFFTMRHMETYMGQTKNWSLGIDPIKDIHFMRLQCIIRLVKSPTNLHRDHVYSAIKNLYND